MTSGAILETSAARAADHSTAEENLRSAGLPTGVQPTVGAFNFNAAPVVVASVSAAGDTDLEAVAEIARTEIIAEHQSLPGVAGADLAGGVEDRLVVTLDPARLAEARVSTQQIVGVLQANNLTLPGGELSVDGERIPVSTIGQFASVEQIENLVVGIRVAPIVPGLPSAEPALPAPSAAVPEPITLGELGSVEIAGLATTGYGRTNGRPAVTISISKTSTANTVTVADAVQARLDEIAARHPGEITIATVSDQSTFILESSEGLLREGGLGAVFAVLTIFLFLFNLRSTFVAAVSIPLSILTALVVMQVAGITLNILTLGGLAVAVGRVVALTVVPVLAYFLVGRVSGAVDQAGEPKNSLWVRLYDPAIRFVLRSRVTRVGPWSSQQSCSSPPRRSCHCCRRDSSTRARRRSPR